MARWQSRRRRWRWGWPARARCGVAARPSSSSRYRAATRARMLRISSPISDRDTPTEVTAPRVQRAADTPGSLFRKGAEDVPAEHLLVEAERGVQARAFGIALEARRFEVGAAAQAQPVGQDLRLQPEMW